MAVGDRIESSLGKKHTAQMLSHISLFAPGGFQLYQGLLDIPGGGTDEGAWVDCHSIGGGSWSRFLVELRATDAAFQIGGTWQVFGAVGLTPPDSGTVADWFQVGSDVTPTTQSHLISVTDGYDWLRAVKSVSGGDTVSVVFKGYHG